MKGGTIAVEHFDLEEVVEAGFTRAGRIAEKSWRISLRGESLHGQKSP
jgi:hypothetical protein